ncbi:PAS domain S-box protein [Methylotenera sp.]|uniref:PAS domain S-box protein n=1 Tax=Methylotenera sp. TaxID=2051956 RepID=UPI002ED9B718
MKKKWDGKDRRSSLRSEAEKVVADIAPPRLDADPGDVLMHELLVHKVELEMQNEELRKAHLEMEEARDRYVNLYEFAPISYITLSREGLISKINLTGCILLGVDRYQLISRRFSHYVAAHDRDRWHRLFMGIMKHPGAERQAFDLQMTRPDGTSYHVQLNCLNWDADEKDNVLRIAITDISKLKLAEAELKIAATVFESYEPMVVTDAHSVILRVNKAFTETTGYTAAEAVGKTPKLLASGLHDDAFYAQMWESINTQGHWIGEIHNKHKNANIYIEHMHITAIKNHWGEVTHYTGIFTDRARDKMNSKEAFKNKTSN